MVFDAETTRSSQARYDSGRTALSLCPIVHMPFPESKAGVSGAGDRKCLPRQSTIRLLLRLSSRLAFLILVFCFDACYVQEKAEHPDPFAAAKRITAEGSTVATPSPAPSVSRQVRMSLPQTIATPARPLPAPQLSADGRLRKRDLGDEIATFEKTRYYSAASAILQSLGVNPAPTGEEALAMLRSRLEDVRTDRDLTPFEAAFHNASVAADAQASASPEKSATPPPMPESTSSPTPSTPIPLSTPHNVEKSNGQLNNQPTNQ
jgi:hypothetical protein